MEDLFVDFTVSILALNKLVQKIKTFEIEKFGLKPIHVMCLYYLYKNPQGLTAKALVELTLEDKAAISRALKIMQDNGYAEYDANGRNAVIVLTDRGKEIASDISERADKAVAAGSVDFTADERIFFYKSLGTIVENLKTYYKDLVKNND
ncbi:MAG: MarR family winged helix-turn-helix transcriptional regulator [Clostridiales bacterium]|nr:MarR family winged helix-turn-helix transcriptional regulator [Clostridiales bacterium]